MPTPKYIARVIALKSGYVCAQTGDCITRQPDSMEVLLDSMQPTGKQKYLHVVTCRDCGTIYGNSYTEIGNKLWDIDAEQQLGGDVYLHFLTKGGKPYTYPHAEF